MSLASPKKPSTNDVAEFRRMIDSVARRFLAKHHSVVWTSDAAAPDEHSDIAAKDWPISRTGPAAPDWPSLQRDAAEYVAGALFAAVKDMTTKDDAKTIFDNASKGPRGPDNPERVLNVCLDAAIFLYEHECDRGTQKPHGVKGFAKEIAKDTEWCERYGFTGADRETRIRKFLEKHFKNPIAKQQAL